MKRALLIVSLAFMASGCKMANRLLNREPDHQNAPDVLADDYTITGITVSNFDLIPVRVADSRVLVQVNRTSAPESGWHDCDSFEILTSTVGRGGGYVRLWYLNLTVGGVSVPVAPAGTEYRIRSVLKTPSTSSADLY